MTLPRKGTRRIVVDGRAYRWAYTGEQLIVEDATTAGARLVVPVVRGYPAPPLLPAEVASLIRQGRQAGWNPTASGPAVRLPTPTPPRPTASATTPPPFTEADWDAATDPFELLRLLHADQDGRPTLLLTVAVFRLAWDDLPGPCRAWAGLVARVAEGDGTAEEINDGTVFDGVQDAFSERAAALSGERRSRLDAVARLAAVGWMESRPAPVPPAVGAPMAALVRDVFGSPFREPLVKCSALGQLIRAIATATYAEERWDDLPILADALEEADAADADVLAHLRSPGPHVRGCWALDLVLHGD